MLASRLMRNHLAKRDNAERRNTLSIKRNGGKHDYNTYQLKGWMGVVK